ncbi:hypothetical protein QFC24_003066 [Naganishia onofrii]|uniref:Uncharacterized protein n=1 Tax=Naganishia onofrii TaxID=1851511 RepID=A0ACC2XML9_9TREE|nr:hypothetical protein QFC24_003066 [Naganishia onofrii]
MSELQAVAVVGHQVKKDTKPYVTYSVKVSTSTRTWLVHRRYNDFTALHAELKSATGKEPPGTLPPKHSWSLSRNVEDPKIIDERQKGLEAYLKAILIHKDPCWRTAYGFLDFLAVPSNTHNTRTANTSATATKLASTLPSAAGNESTLLHTSTSWMTEYTALQHVLRSVRASLLKRDALAQLGDASGSRSAGVDAKRSIKDLKNRLSVLEKGLPLVEGLGQGERSRREGMVGSLKDETANVEKMAEAGIRVTPQSNLGNSSSPGGSRAHTPAVNEASRAALLGSAITANTPPTRVFGTATLQSGPQETAQTRPLDDSGLIQMQQSQMDQQDAQLSQLSAILQRQMRIGQEIGREVDEQNELLDNIDSEVDRVGGKLSRAKRQLNRLG